MAPLETLTITTNPPDILIDTYIFDAGSVLLPLPLSFRQHARTERNHCGTDSIKRQWKSLASFYLYFYFYFYFFGNKCVCFVFLFFITILFFFIFCWGSAATHVGVFKWHLLTPLLFSPFSFSRLLTPLLPLTCRDRQIDGERERYIYIYCCSGGRESESSERKGVCQQLSSHSSGRSQPSPNSRCSAIFCFAFLFV